MLTAVGARGLATSAWSRPGLRWSYVIGSPWLADPAARLVCGIVSIDDPEPLENWVPAGLESRETVIASKARRPRPEWTLAGSSPGYRSKPPNQRDTHQGKGGFEPAIPRAGAPKGGPTPEPLILDSGRPGAALGFRVAMLTFVQTSDVHFRGYDDAEADDLDYELRNELLRDIRRNAADVGGVSGVLVCGDIAFSGSETEYSQASSWLRDLCAAIEVEPWFVWVIPGNHDVQHGVIKGVPKQTKFRATLRDTPAERLSDELAQLLRHPDDGPACLVALENYLRFAAQFGCEFDHRQLHWSTRLPLEQEWELQMRGMTSALVSDDYDDTKANRLVVGEAQAMVTRADYVVHLTMCHHPEKWLHDGEQVRKRLDPIAHVQITGHEHQHGLRKTHAGVHLAAGALHPERPHKDAFEPRYNIVSLDLVRGGAETFLDVYIRARVWDEDGRVFRADPEYPDGVVAYRLQAGGGHSSCPQPTPRPEATAIQLEDHCRRLRHRLNLLRPADQHEALTRIGAPVAQLVSGAETGVAGRVVRWARDNGAMRALWTEVERCHGDQAGGDNPF